MHADGVMKSRSHAHAYDVNPGWLTLQIPSFVGDRTHALQT